MEFIALTVTSAFLIYFYAALFASFYRHFFCNDGSRRTNDPPNDVIEPSSVEYEKQFRSLYRVPSSDAAAEIRAASNSASKPDALQVGRFDSPARLRIYDRINDVRESPVEPEFSKDAWDPWFPANEYRLPVEATLEIEYTDIEDQFTSRRITTQYIGTPSEKMVSAYCHLRRANRSFRNERIEGAVDCVSGEVIDDVWEWLYKKHAESVEATVRQMIEKEKAIALALHFVARANGVFSAKKKAVVAAALRAISRDERIDDDYATRFVDSVKLPTIIDYRRALKTIAKGDVYKRLVIAKCIEQMIATRKRPNAIETMAVEEMVKTIGAKPKGKS